MGFIPASPNPVPPNPSPPAPPSLPAPTDEASEAAGKDEEQRREPQTHPAMPKSQKRYHTEAHPALRAATFVFMVCVSARSHTPAQWG